MPEDAVCRVRQSVASSARHDDDTPEAYDVRLRMALAPVPMSRKERYDSNSVVFRVCRRTAGSAQVSGCQQDEPSPAT